MDKVIHHLRRVALPPDGGPVEDAQLIDRFVTGRDEIAFEAIMRRYGPMVLGVCRRVLGNQHDAEDAFQATFLILIRKAASLRRRRLIGNWLYGVAYRTSVKARTMTARRHMRELRGAVTDAVKPPTGGEGVEELLTLLDKELNRLPEKYRVAVILCELQGISRKDAARVLGWPEGTLSSRLSRARAMLAKRMATYGETFSSGVVATALSKSAASAAVQPLAAAPLMKAAALIPAGKTPTGVSSTRVIALSEGMVKAMFISRFQLVTVVFLLAGFAAGGLGIATYLALGAVEPAWTQDRPSSVDPGGSGAKTTPSAAPGSPAETVAAPVWKETASLQTDAGAVYSVALSLDGKQLVVGCGKGPNNGAVELWDPATGKRTGELTAEDRLPDTPKLALSIVEGVAFSPDGIFTLARTTTNRQAVILWDRASGKQLPPVESYVLDTKGVVFGADSKTLVGAKYHWKEGPGGTTILDKLEIKIWDLSTGREKASTRAQGSSVSTVAISSENKYVAWSDDALRLWDVAADRQQVLLESKDWLTGATFSPNGHLLAAVLWDGKDRKAEVKLWDVTTGKEQLALKSHSGHISALAFSPNGKTIATAGEDKIVRIWDTATGKELLRLRGHKDWILAVSFGKDGRSLATGSQDGTVKLWELAE